VSKKKLKSATESETGTGLISESETDRSLKIGDNQTGDLMEQPDISPRFVCDICGRSFDNEKSLKMHKLRAHRVSPHRPKRGEGGRATRLPRYEAEPSIPDPYQHLKRMLMVYGLSEKNADAIVEFVKPYGVDHLPKLVEAASTYMPRDRLRLFVESWCNVRRIPLPPELAEELGIELARPIRFHYGYYDHRRPRYEGESDYSSLASVITAIGNLLKGVGTNQHQTPPSTSNEVISGLQNQISTLQEELKTLRSQLEEERRRALEKELKELREKVKELEKGKMADKEVKKLDILDKRLADLTSLLSKIVESSIVPVQVQPPKREESAESTRVELPPELVWQEG